MIMKNLKVNQLMDIVLEGEFSKEYYPVRIEDIDSQYIYMGMPMKHGGIVRLQSGQEIKCIFRDVIKCYGFSTTVIDIIKRPIPMLIADKPNEFLVVNQKRSYVRLQVVLPVKYRIVDENNGEEHKDSESRSYQGQTVNISAGGILFSTDIRLERQQYIEIELFMPNRQCFKTKAKILRVFDKIGYKKGKFWIAIEYEDVSDAERDRIFNYIFEKERELIKYGFKL